MRSDSHNVDDIIRNQIFCRDRPAISTASLDVSAGGLAEIVGEFACIFLAFLHLLPASTLTPVTLYNPLTPRVGHTHSRPLFVTSFVRSAGRDELPQRVPGGRARLGH
jgi:hypothetical protein